MMRRLLPVLAVLALALPLAAAPQFEQALPAGSDIQVPIDASPGAGIEISVAADVPIDIMLLRGGDAAAFYNGSIAPVWAVYNNTSAHAEITLHDTAGLFLLVDNSGNPKGGAPGDHDANATIQVVVHNVVVTPSSGPAAGSFWRTLMFTAHHWTLGPVGFGGVALWMVIFAVLAAVKFDAGWSRLGTLVVGAAALTMLWALLPHPGVISQVGLPMLWGAGLGYLAVKGARTLPAALRLAVLSTILGSFVGLAVGHYVRALWAGSSMLVLGGDRFTDALFVVPATAVLVVLLLEVIPAFVEALEDEAGETQPAKEGQGPTFSVACLRCGTAITVNRSMKRYRVATDRYEFACPNCHAWMEWSEPKQPSAA